MESDDVSFVVVISLGFFVVLVLGSIYLYQVHQINETPYEKCIDFCKSDAMYEPNEVALTLNSRMQCSQDCLKTLGGN